MIKSIILIGLLSFFSYNAMSGAGTFPQGDHVKLLKDALQFKNSTLGITDLESVSFKQQVGTGLIDGGLVTIGAPTSTFSVSLGEGVIADHVTTPLAPTVTRVTWTAQSNIVLDNIAADFTTIYIDGAGVVQQKVDDFLTPVEERRYILLGTAVHTSHTAIDSLIQASRPAYGGLTNLQDLASSIGPINRAGNIYSGNGLNLSVDKSAGQTYAPGTNYAVDKESPNIRVDIAASAPIVTPIYRDGGGGTTVGVPSVLIDPTVWDDGTGVLNTVNANNWVVHRLYYTTSGQLHFIQYGQAEYNNQAAALDGILSEAFITAPELAGSAFRSWLVVRGGATFLVDPADAIFIEADKFGQSPVSGGVASAGDFQAVYNNSTQPQIVLDTVRLGMQILDGLPAIADKLFEILSNDTLTEYFSVDALWAYVQGQPIVVADTAATDGTFAVRDSTATNGYIWSSSVSGALSNVTAWQDYVPVTQGFGTISNVEVSYRVIGDSIEINGKFTTGTVTASEAQVSLPNGWVVSPKFSTIRKVGKGNRTITSATVDHNTLATAGDTYINFGLHNGVAGATGMNPTSGTPLMGNSEVISFDAIVPILGLKSSVDIAATTQQFPVVIGRGNGNDVIAANGRIVFTELEDTTNSWDTNNTFTAPENGYYLVVGAINTSASTNASAYFFKNGARDLLVGFNATSNSIIPFEGVIKLNKDDTLSIEASKAMTLVNSGDLHNIHIQKIVDTGVIASTRDKWQKKDLPSAQTGTGVVSSLTFNNLEIGKTYNLNGQFYFQRSTTSVNAKKASVTVTNGALALPTIRPVFGNLSDVIFQVPVNYQFTATATTVTFNCTELINLQINGGSNQTYIILTEKNNTSETTGF